jgi:myotubularin-related protein 3/4
VGSEDTNERCPVFLQWIDCVQQIHHQYPCSFEFSKGFLIKLAQHVHSCLFGTFLCNTLKERLENSIFDRTFSVWPFLSSPIYKNPLYQPNKYKVLWPSHNVRNLVLWNDFYLGSFHTPRNNENLEISNDTIYTENGLIKTRSFDDLVSELKSKENSTRRLSDPSIVFGDNNMPLTVSIFQENSSSSSSSASNHINNNISNNNASNHVDMKTIVTENGNGVGHESNDAENGVSNCDEESKDEVLNCNGTRSNHNDAENTVNNSESTLMTDEVRHCDVEEKVNGNEEIRVNGIEEQASPLCDEANRDEVDSVKVCACILDSFA